MEHSIWEIAKWMMFFVMFMVMFAFGLFFIQIQDLNPYKQMVNYTIEREGGLTESALDLLHGESAAAYDSKYTVELLTEDANGDVTVGNKKYKASGPQQSQPFGTPVIYRVKMKFVMPFFDIGMFETEAYGNSVSQIRG